MRREFHKEAPEWKKHWLKTRKVFYTFVAGQFIPTAPKILRKGDAATIQGGLRPPEEVKEGLKHAGADALEDPEVESARRLMMYDEEDVGEQLGWGMAPTAAASLQDFGLGGAWQSAAGNAGLVAIRHEVRECRVMLTTVMAQLEKQGSMIQKLQN